MDVTQLVNNAQPVGYPSVARGYVSPTKPAPVTFGEGVWVILPEGSTEHLYGPCKWGAIHGTRLPAQGAACVVVFDEQNFPTVVWWDGAQKEPIPGAESITEAMLASAVAAKLNPGAWTILEEINGNVEAVAGAEALGVRVEQGKTVARLRGILRIKAAGEIKSGVTIAKLPVGFRPAKEVKPVLMTTVGYGIVSATAAGVLTASVTLTAESFFGFDGITFNLT